jgi:enoyl-CoA hydratase/carnithine racemase
VAAPALRVPVAVQRTEGVATVVVDNPPVNALDDATLVGLRKAAEAISVDQEIRAVVLTGSGERAFIAGADLRSLQAALGPDADPGELQHHVSLTGPAFTTWRSIPQPVVAAVTANALGGGLEFALCCDLIVADPRARFGLPEVTLGLMPGGGGTQRLPQRIGFAATLELVLLGRIIDASRAHELGLVHVIADESCALERARTLATHLASLPAVAIQSAKRALWIGLDRGLADGLAAERKLFLEVARSSDAREGSESFLARRTPVFTHR